MPFTSTATSRRDAQTDPEVGYVILETDVPGGESEELLADLKGVPGTIRVRVLYDQTSNG